MSSKLDLIRKYAQEIDDVPVRTSKKKPVDSGTPAAPANPASDVPERIGDQYKNAPRAGSQYKNAPFKPGYNPHTASIIAASVAAVKEMQLAMQALAQTVVEDSQSSTMAFKPKDTTQAVATDQVKSSKKSFNDFIAEQYLGNLDEDKKGVEWSKNTSITSLPNKQKSQTDIYELDVVMDTLRRIGASSKEFAVDGKWDFRTDNALRNMMGFAYALLQLEGDFGLSNTVYNITNWNDFNSIMSNYKIENGVVKLSPSLKKAKAIQITKHLKAIAKLYNHFRQQVLARPEFRPTIEGKRSFDRYTAKNSDKELLTPQEDQMSKSDAIKIPVVYDAPRLPSKKLNEIPLKALRNKEEYIKWMVDYAGNTEASAIDIFNKVIKPKIESM